MAQIDFRQAFASPETKPASTDSAETARIDQPNGQVDRNVRRQIGRISRFDRSNWANIAFVAVTIIGGLFCAFYFFTGGELLRAAAAWPREFLYSRPFGIVGHGKIDKSHDFDDPASPFAKDSPASSTADPFRRVRFPDLSQPPSSFASSPAAASNPSTATLPSTPPLVPPPFNPGPLLDGLNPFPPGGDFLSQAFNQAVADLQRISNLAARHTVVVVETAPSAARMRAAKAAQNAKQAAQNATARTTGTAGSTAQSLQQISQNATTTTQNQVASTQNQAAAMTQRATGMGQQTLGNLRGVTGNGLSGLGGLNGGLLGGGGVHLGGGGGHGRH